LIDSNLMQLLPLEFSKKIVKSLMGETDDALDETAATLQAVPSPVQQVASPAPVQQQAAQPVYQEQPMIQTSQRPAQPVNVQQAQFASFESANISQSEARNLNMLLDIPLQVTVELGRTKRSVKEILELSSGSIIELDKLAGEPVDILVNSRLIAKGEVVVIDENFGVRITDVLSQAERLNNLR
ncbi:MAG: flagellar motor switch protein FliN, partial [Carnobacterium sp.]